MITTRGRIGEYALVQFSDYALGPMIWTALASFLVGGFPLIMMNVHAAEMNPVQRATMLGGTYGTLIGVLATLGSLLGVARFVSSDRSPGLTRFLFSKPVGVRRYYLQAWSVRAVTLLALTAISVLLIDQFIFPVRVIGAIATVGVAFLLIGGVGYLLSVVTAQDTLTLIVVYLVPDMLNGLKDVWPSWAWLFKGLLAIMPPMHQLDEIRQALLQNTQVDQGMLWHAVLYGAGCVALATYLVRRMPLVR